jgi:hypothetical protein
MFHDLFWTVKTAWPADTFTSHISSSFNCNNQHPKDKTKYTPPWQEACMAWQLLSDSPADNAQLSFYFAASYWGCMANVPAQLCVCVEHWTEPQNSHDKEFLWLKKKGQTSLQDINVGHNWHIQPPYTEKSGCHKILITSATLLPAPQCSHTIPSNTFCGVFIRYVTAKAPDCIWKTVLLCHLIWSLNISTSKCALKFETFIFYALQVDWHVSSLHKTVLTLVTSEAFTFVMCKNNHASGRKGLKTSHMSKGVVSWRQVLFLQTLWY